jgi:hypothetical protein
MQVAAVDPPLQAARSFCHSFPDVAALLLTCIQ